MKVSALAYAAVVGLALAGCTSPQQPSQASRPTDTGNMAYPSPQPQGEVGNTTAGGRTPADTGNMAYPAPQAQGQVGSSMPAGRRRPTDTGNMAFPTPQPQGQIGTTRVR